MSELECGGKCYSLTESGGAYLDPQCPKHGEPLHCNDRVDHAPHNFDAAIGYPGPPAWFRCPGGKP